MKKLVVLATVFAGLAAFVYFYEIAGEESREKAKELEESLFRLEQDQIQSVEIIRTGKESVLLDKAGDSWMVRRPVETSADKGTVDALLRNITSAKRVRTFEEPDQDLSAFGLSNPSLELRVRTGDGEEVLLVGNQDFSNTNLYAKLGNGPEVFLTSTMLKSSADKEVADWRNKNALLFDRSRVEALRVQREGGELELERKEDRWNLVKPIADLADETAVSSLLSTLEFARAQEFVSEQPTDLAEYGLDTPALVVRVREQGSDSWQELDIGKADEEFYYARDPQRSPVFTVNKDLYADLTKDVSEFRDRDIVDVKQDQIVSLEIRRGETPIRLRREDFKWIIEQPEELKDKEALGYKFWYPIDDMKFTEILAEPVPIEEPVVELAFQVEGEGDRLYRFGKSGEDYVALQVSGGRSGKITEEDFHKLELDPAELVGD